MRIDIRDLTYQHFCNGLELRRAAIRDIIKLINVNKNEKEITFFSESKAYNPFLIPSIKKIISSSNYSVCVLCCDKDDPILSIKKERLSSYFIGKGIIRNIAFNSLMANILVSTTPDLGRFGIRRSKLVDHYLYIPHTAGSLQFYNKKALSRFDSILSAGPHQTKEILDIKATMPREQKVYEYGYDLIKYFKTSEVKKDNNKTILIAPTCGKPSALRHGLINFVKKLVNSGYHVIFRPHPFSNEMDKGYIRKMKKEIGGDIEWDTNSNSYQSFFRSSCLITDTSASALDYALLTKKPIFAFDYIKNAKRYIPWFGKYSSTPIQIEFHNKYSTYIDINSDGVNIIEKVINTDKKIEIVAHDYIYNTPESAILDVIRDIMPDAS